MGCDGGTIPTRGELVKTKKKPEQLSKETELAVKWQHCTVSQEPLGQQVVSCRLGQLYNKEALIEFLLTRSKSSGGVEARLDHIRGLKDFKELRLTPNPAFHLASDTKYGAGATGERMNTARFICPVTGLEMNGRFRFSYLLTCGCTFSERALVEVREVGSAGCLQCGRAFTRKDVVPINGDEEEVESLRERMEAEKQARLSSKKGKRAKTTGGEEGGVNCTDDPACKKQKQECDVTSGQSSRDSSNVDKSREDVVKQGDMMEVEKPEQQGSLGEENGTGSKNGESGGNRDSERSGDSGKNGHRSEGSSKNGHRSEDSGKNGHRSEDSGKNGKRSEDSGKNGHGSEDRGKNGHSSKSSDNGKGKKLMRNGEGSSGSMDTKKVKSIQQDSGATETFKSLFNTHPTALKQGKAHWVTYNPQYN